MVALGGEPMRDHLFQDLALDRTVGHRRIAPPPAVTLHRPGGGDKPGRDRIEVGVGGLLFRTVHLFFIKDVQSGLVWFTKIITDPFHDIMLYHKAPLYLLRGEMLDPGHEDEWVDEDAEEAPRAG